MTRSEFVVGVVITTSGAREENLKRTLSCLLEVHDVEAVVVVYDGCSLPSTYVSAGAPWKFYAIEAPKHEPGLEQPRNLGARELQVITPQCNLVWFLDSDMVFGPEVLDAYRAAHEAADEDRVLIGPYEWLAPGETAPRPDLHNDIRWASFNERGPDYTFRSDLGCGLACFGGNMIWPVYDFQHVGGFHPELHHGRCEDGELGLRAAAAGVPMALVRDARVYHVAHSVDGAWVARTNARDVPLLNSWHPEIEREGFLLTEADGARFDFACTWPGCDLIMNNHDHWNHLAQHRLGQVFTFADPASVRHLEVSDGQA